VEPDWLAWARELQAVAQTGLTYAKDPHDIERYTALRRLAARMMAAGSGTEAARIEALFAAETGYATPKLGVRGAVFDPDGRILLVREAVDEGRWSLPGGWAEVNQTPAESMMREVAEESGYLARPVKLAAVWDRARQGHPPGPFSVTRLFFVCALAGGEPRTSLETTEIAWFAEDALPEDLSHRRVLPHQIRRMFDHWRDPSLPTDFE
jgi:ADP-ribose pyrophosphatase YjhB (NUDIX family)